MRKFFTVIFLTVAIVCQAQHLKFMGIPLDGNINSFQQKLISKGLRPDKEANAITPVGIRMYNGEFCGYDATIVVFYEKKSKNVYSAKAVVRQSEVTRAKSTSKDLCSRLFNKYGGNVGEDDNGFATYEYHMMEKIPELGDRFFNEIGVITLNVTNPEYDYFIHIEYYDSTNGAKNEELEDSDL